MADLIEIPYDPPDAQAPASPGGELVEIPYNAPDMAASAEPAIEIPYTGGAVPNMSVGQPLAPTPRPENLSLAEGLDFAQNAINAKPLVDVIHKFKESYINPLVEHAQTATRKMYFGEDPNARKGQVSPKGAARGYGTYLREERPGAAVIAESLARPFIGKTSYNVGSKTGIAGVAGIPVGSPVEDNAGLAQGAVQGIENLQQHFGETGAAAMQAMASGFGELPLWLIPGVGKSPVVQGATAGALSAAVDPEADLLTGAVGGGVMGKAAQVLGPKVVKAYQWAKGKIRPEVHMPVAVVPGSEVGNLADKFLELQPAELMDVPKLEGELRAPLEVTNPVTTPQRSRPKGPPVTVAAGLTADGKLTMKAVHMEPDGTFSGHATDAVPPGTTPVISDDLMAQIRADPNGPLADAVLGPAPTTAAERRIAIARGEPLLDPAATAAERMDRLDDIKEGLTLVIQGGDGNGTARLHAINSPALQREALRSRTLVEITHADGRKELAFYGGEGSQTKQGMGPKEPIMLPADPAEGLPRAREGIRPLEEGATWAPVEDTQKLNKILVERKALLQEQADVQARIAADADASARDVALGGDGSGNNLPPPPGHLPPDGPPPPPNPHMAAIEPTAPIAKTWMQRMAAIPGIVKRGLINPTMRGPKDLADLSMMAHSLHTFESLKLPVYAALQKAAPELAVLPPVQQKAVHASLVDFNEGRLSLDQLRATHPELRPSIYNELMRRKNETLRDEETLRELGMLNPDQKLEDLLDPDAATPEYLTKMYYRFLQRKEGDWARQIAKDKVLVSRIKDAILKDVYTGGKYANSEYAERVFLAKRHFDLITGDPAALKAANAADPKWSPGELLSVAQGSLKARKDLRWWEKAALGEVDNAFVRMAETTSRQKQLIAQGAMWEQVSLNLEMASYTGKEGWTQLAMNPNKYGRAAGMWIHPDMIEAVITAPAAQRGAAVVFPRFVNALKYNQTVLNPGSWVTNFAGNAQSAALSNLVDPFGSPYKLGQGMHQFFKDTKAYQATAGLAGSSVAHDRMVRMMELGVVGSDFATAEFKESANAWARLLDKEAAANKGRINAHDLLVGMAEGKHQLSNFYSSIDTMWKYSAAMAGLEKGGIHPVTGVVNEAKAIKFIGDRYRPGMTAERLKEQVELEVARRIHLSFPMLDRVGSWVAQGGKYAGILAPYLKIQAELARIYAQAPVRAAPKALGGHGEAGMAGNMLKYGAVVAAVSQTMPMLRRANGISDEEVEQAWASAPASTQRFKIGAMVLPFRSSQGKLTIIDFTQLFHPLTFLQGNPHTAAPARILQNLALLPANGGLIDAPYTDLLSSAGLLDPGYQREVPEWQRTPAFGAARAATAGAPGFLRNTYNTMERGGMGFEPKGWHGPSADTAAPEITAINMAAGPNRLQEIGGEAARLKALAIATAEAKQAEMEYRKIKYLNEGQSTGTFTGPLDKKAALERAFAIAKEKSRRVQELSVKVNQPIPPRSP